MSIDAPGPDATRWDRFLYWANRFFQEPHFDKDEREYKIVVFERLEAARTAFEAGEPTWVDKLNHAITAKPNNLTNWRATQPLVAWCRAKPDDSSLGFRFLWNKELPVSQRFDKFVDIVATTGPRMAIAETSFFHVAMDYTAFPVYRPTAVERAMTLTGYPEPKEVGIKSGEMGRRYDHYLRFLDIMMKRALEAGIEFRDRLDAQGVSWTVSQWHPESTWSEADQQAFLAYQGEARMRKDSWAKPARM